MQQGLEDFTAFRVKILERINFLEKKIIRTEEEFAKKN